MPRLFIAIDLPEETQSILLPLLPSRGRGVRPTSRGQLHLTLLFLGERELSPIARALQTVVAPSFFLTLEGVGRFGQSPREVILWAGFRESPELRFLHAALTAALIPTGYQPESRPYTPHLTLARCRSETPSETIDLFLQQNARFTSPAFPVTEFSLYSSVLTPDGPKHQREQMYSMASTRQS